MIPESIKRGISILRGVISTLPSAPGVYRMLGKDDAPLYVGKAKNLKKRVVSYTHIEKLPLRLRRMVSEILRMEIVVTKTETEALLLENNIIKKLQPHYNVLLKDDKSFPSIYFTPHSFPRILKYRGKREEGGYFFGPFASAQAVDDTIINLQKTFRLRNCSDEIFKNRRRPCIQYDIKRCSAPCVGYITEKRYKDSCAQAMDVLRGKSDAVQKILAEHMHTASDAMHFEEAAQYRDRIKMLASLQTHQRIHVTDVTDADIFGIAQVGKTVCVQVYFYRNGCNYGTQSFFLSHPAETLSENLEAFLKQFYVSRLPAALVLLSHHVDDLKLIAQSFSKNSENAASIKWQVPKMGEKRDLTQHACDNAQQSIERTLAEKANFKQLFEEIAGAFTLPKTPERIEVYDNSHIQGKEPYGVMVVANQEGMDKKSYRKFKIGRAAPTPLGGDDYAMMREVMERRFARMDEEGWSAPDLLLIDGGLGQVNAVVGVLEEKGLTHIPVVGMSKGKERRVGEEIFIQKDHPPIKLDAHSQAFYLLQRMRDEAHRFGITAHRRAREKTLKRSLLDDISGIGAKRKKALLSHFGSAQQVARAALEDILLVPGIDQSVAKKIYAYFHQN